ncbi:MAG: phosphatidylserine decarboxylase [Candidatus Dadabacteria bacterium]|nr:phosphatidylserine decarboxylase [Candidatus Dadabacteria bacterium]
MKTPFLRIAPEGLSLLCSIAAAGWLFSFLGLGVLSFLCMAAFGFSVYFFRDPDREFSPEPGAVFAPSDGRVIAVSTESEDTFLGREVTRVSVFLSIFDCHVNWFPVSGTVLSSERRAGRFHLGFSPKAGDENERVATVIHPDGAPDILMFQVAGFVARRIISYAGKGMSLEAGERFGIIKFGSRIDLFFPPQYKVEVRRGDVLTGRRTVVARLSGEGQ